jgi:hypothetical protein
MPETSGSYDVALTLKERHERDEREPYEAVVECVASSDWPDLYYGLFDARWVF